MQFRLVRMLALLLVSLASIHAQEDLAQWAHAKSIVLNTSATGFDITEDLHGFPFLVRLTSKDFDFSQAQGRGQDLRFTKSDGTTALAYEIERWDSARSAAVWVLLDTIYGNRNNQSFTMHWGASTGSATPSLSNGPAVFDTANGFMSVWHLDSLLDATASADNGTNFGSEAKPGVIGNGRYFNEARVEFPKSTHIRDLADSIYISAWVRPVSQPPAGWTSTIRHDGHFSALQYWNGTKIWAPVWNPELNGWIQIENGGFDEQVWQFYTVTYSSSAGGFIYRNGSEVQSFPSVFGAMATTATAPFVIGGREGGSEYFPGLIDEVVVSKSRRSEAWIRLSYLNQLYTPDARPVIDYPRRDYYIVQNFTMDPIVPELTGWVEAVTITPELPPGLSFGAGNGSIYGFPADTFDAQVFVVRATNSLGSSEDTITLACGSSMVGAVARQGGRGLSMILPIAEGARCGTTVRLPARHEFAVVAVRLFSLDGRLICSRSIRAENLTAGTALLFGTGRRAAGAYVAAVRCLDARGTTTFASTTMFTID